MTMIFAVCRALKSGSRDDRRAAKITTPLFRKDTFVDTHPQWQWNEMQQVGTDYADLGEVERYERRMGQFRDLAKEDAEILAELRLKPGSRILEIGTGTGHFARTAVGGGHRVTATDVSPIMLQYAAKVAQGQGLAIEFTQGGFLTFQGEPAAYDGVVSVVVLHHLPDLWKAVALANIRRILKPKGRMVLRDVVFAFGAGGHAEPFDGFVNACPPSMNVETARHIAKEYSTLDWIMEGLLTRAGFSIEKKTAGTASIVQYVCVAV